MVSKEGLIVEKIKVKKTQDGKPYYLVFFKDLLISVTKQDGLIEDRPRAFFCWEDSQAYQMLHEGIFKEGDKINVHWTEEDNYCTLHTLSRYVTSNDPLPGKYFHPNSTMSRDNA